MNIILCGMMGVGKSSVGMKIAELTGRKWVDTDLVIESRHGRISDIFEYYGEAHFRGLESELVEELAKQDGLVISTGGGLVLRHENNELLKQNGKIFYLKASFESIYARVRADETRPLLGDLDKTAERLEELLSDRLPIYEHVADYTVETDEKTVEETAAEIIALIAGEQA